MPDLPRRGLSIPIGARFAIATATARRVRRWCGLRRPLQAWSTRNGTGGDALHRGVFRSRGAPSCRSSSHGHECQRIRLERLAEWGLHARLRLSRRWGRRPRCRAREGQGGDPIHPGPPRGDGGVHGVGARQVHRRGRALLRDLGPGGDPSAERSLRRQDGPRSRRRHRRPAGAHGDRRQLPAGSRPANLFKDVAGDYVATASVPSRCGI